MTFKGFMLNGSLTVWDIFPLFRLYLFLQWMLMSLITKSVPPVCTKSVPLGNSKLVNIVEMCQEIFDSITFT